MKIKLSMLIILLNFLSAISQNTEKINYAKTEIEVPNTYEIDRERSIIKNDSFSVHWLLQDKFSKNDRARLMKKACRLIDGKMITKIDFMSNGAKMSGKIYQLNADKGLKFQILASGIIDDLPLFLQLGFKSEPKSNADLDELMLKFISSN